MKIVLIVEGETEQAFKVSLKRFLDARCEAENKPKVRIQPDREPQILKPSVVKGSVARYLTDADCLGVALLIDVAPEFSSPGDVRQRYAGCGPTERFRVHCALHDFEAWLLPYQTAIHQQANRPAPKGRKWPNPETVNLTKPPSYVLRHEVFTGKPGYRKTIHAPRILEGQDLTIAAEACPQLKAFLNTLLEFAGVGRIS